MAIAEELQILVDAKVNSAVRDLKKTQKETNNLGKSAKNLVKSLLPVAGATAAIVGLAKGAKAAEEAFFQQEKAVALLNASLQATGQFTSSTSQEIQDFASELQGVTTVGDEASIQLTQFAVSAGLSADQAKQATKDAIGLSKAFGVDLQAAIKATTNAQQGDFNQLNRYIPAVKNAKDETEKAAIAQQSLANAFEVAKKEADTAIGAQQQYQNAIGDTQEILGAYVAEGLTPVRRAFTELLTEINNTLSAEKILRDVIAGQVNDSASLSTAIERQEERLEELNAQSLRGINVNKQLREEEERLLKLKTDLVAAQRAEASQLRAQTQARNDAQAAAEAEAERLEREAALTEKYADARKLVVDVLQSEKTEADKLQETYDQLAGSPWAGGKLEEERIAAMEILQERIVELRNTEESLWSERGDWIEEWRQQQIAAAEETGRVNEENAAKIQASYENAFNFAGSAISDLTFALASGEDAYKSFARVGLTALSELLSALGAKLAAIAAEALALSFIPPFVGGAGAGPALAGSAAAFAASGAVRAAAGNFQQGTPAGQPFTVPGTPGRDSQPIMVEPGEEVTVNSRARSARGDTKMANITLNIDGRAFGKLILDLSRDRVVTLDRGALVAT
jgi:hypothetical protein